MRRTLRSPLRATGLWLALAAALTSRASLADNTADEAELHFQIGNEAYQQARYRDALEHFFLSNRLAPNRNVVFNIARAYERTNQFDNAFRYYTDALEGETDAATRARIETALRNLSPNVAVLRVETTPPGATVYIDRRDLGARGVTPRALAFPEGRYRVFAELQGYELAQSEPLELHRGQVQTVRLSLTRIVGQVRVEGDANTIVRVDDEHAPQACVSPCALDLSPGPHTLFFTREGFITQSRGVTVEPRQRGAVSVTLQPQVGGVVVDAEERGAAVQIDGRTVGFTPLVSPNVLAGRRRVRVSLPGFVTYERTVEVRPNLQTELGTVALLPIREVTAVSRAAENIDDAPSSVTVLDARELRAFAFPTLPAALTGVRGLSLSNDGSYTSLSIRGLGQPSDFGRRLLLLYDGQVTNDNVTGSTYIGYDGRVDLMDVERVEVVRGPGSLMYGTGALSGVVNIVDRERESPGGVQASFGTADNNVARVRARGGYNNGNSGFWVSAGGAWSPGRDATLSLADTNTGIVTPTNVSGLEQFNAVNVSARAWSGIFSARAFFNRRDQVQVQGVSNYNVGDPRSRWIDTRGLLELRLEPRISRLLQFLARVYLNVYAFDSQQAYDPSPQVPPSQEAYRGVWAGLETRLVITPSDRWRINAGLQFDAHPLVSLAGMQPGYTDPITNRPQMPSQYLNTTQPYYSGSAYVVADGNPVRWFRFSAGVRLDLFSYLLSTPAVNPRAALIFRPYASGILKVLGGTAFRAPTSYERLYNDGGASQQQAQNLTPEQSYSGELEFTHRFDENWSVLVDGHFNYIRNFVDQVSVNANVVQYQNRTNAGAITAGADVELRRQWRGGWMLAAQYGYLYAAYDGPALAQLNAGRVGSQVISDGRLVNVPAHSASVRGVVPLIPGVLQGAARVSLMGPRRISLDRSAQDIALNRAYSETDPAVLADLVVTGTVERLGVRYAAGVYNLFDWRWNIAVQGFAGGGLNTMPQPGRTLMLNLSWDL